MRQAALSVEADRLKAEMMVGRETYIARVHEEARQKFAQLEAVAPGP